AGAWRPPPAPPAAASTRARTMRPPGPVPVRAPRSTPRARAIRRATGEALMRSGAPGPGVAAAVVPANGAPASWATAGSGAGAGEGGSAGGAAAGARVEAPAVGGEEGLAARADSSPAEGALTAAPVAPSPPA